MKKTLELTPKQMAFVNIFIEKGLKQSAKQCAIDAGYNFLIIYGTCDGAFKVYLMDPNPF